MALTKKKKTIEWLIKNYGLFLAEFGMNEEEIFNRFDKYKEKFSGSVEDFLWGTFNYLKMQIGYEASDVAVFYEKTDRVNIEMCNFRRKYENQPSNKLWKIWVENRMYLDLERTANSRLVFDFAVHTPDGCNVCNSIQGKLIPESEALKNETIPYDTCDRIGGCLCMMTLIPRRNIEGALVRKID